MSGLSLIERLRERIKGPTSDKPEGEAGISSLGHREYVGGLWEQIGLLQFEFMLDQGLRPDDCLLDIACGSLRGGVHFIPYLDVGGYLGLEKERALIDAGLAHELDLDLAKQKRPEFVVSDRFEFQHFSRVPEWSIAQSLFTHLNETDIRLCLRQLRAFVHRGHRFFATFHETPSVRNPRRSHSHGFFGYSRAAMARMGLATGWSTTCIGDWWHPRGQRMMRFVAD